MSRRAIDPVDRAFEQIAGLTPEQYERLNERLKGWLHIRGVKDAPVPRKRREKKQEPPVP